MSSSSSKRFEYNDPSPLEKKRRELERLGREHSGTRWFPISCTNLLAGFAVVVAVAYAWFAHYPEPAMSPMLFQWQEMGSDFQYRSYKIFYLDKKPNQTDPVPKNRLLLYLHGFPTSSYDMYKLIQPLLQHFDRIVAPDFIGFGFSDKPVRFSPMANINSAFNSVVLQRYYRYSVKDQADLVESLMAHLGLNRDTMIGPLQIHLLSHDYGDSVAQELLARNQSRNFDLASVTMLNGGIFPSKHRPVLMQKVFRIPIISSIVSRFSNIYLFDAAISEVFGPGTKPSRSEVYDMWKLIRLQEGYLVWSSLLSYIDERVENEDRWIEALRQCPVPLHFIYGPADPVNPPPFDEFYREVIPRPSIDTLPGIGHYPQLESPEQVVESMLKFFKKHSLLH